MRPCSPEPRTSSMFTDCSSAALRDDGVASGAPVAPRDEIPPDADAMTCVWDSRSFGAGAGAALLAAVAPSSIWQRSAFTGSTSPSFAEMRATRPAAGDGSSLSALSVAISTSGWSLVTTSPSRTSHLVMVPSETLSPSWGMVTSIMFRCLELEYRKPTQENRGRG